MKIDLRHFYVDNGHYFFDGKEVSEVIYNLIWHCACRGDVGTVYDWILQENFWNVYENTPFYKQLFWLPKQPKYGRYKIDCRLAKGPQATANVITMSGDVQFSNLVYSTDRNCWKNHFDSTMKKMDEFIALDKILK